MKTSKPRLTILGANEDSFVLQVCYRPLNREKHGDDDLMPIDKAIVDRLGRLPESSGYWTTSGVRQLRFDFDTEGEAHYAACAVYDLRPTLLRAMAIQVLTSVKRNVLYGKNLRSITAHLANLKGRK